MMIASLWLAASVSAATPELEQHWSNQPDNPTPTVGATESHYRIGMTRAQLDAETGAQLGLGRQLVDIEMQFNGSANIFAGVWKPVNGLVFPIFEATEAQFDAWFDDMASREGRFLDFEITVRNGAYRFNGLFLQDGDDYDYDFRTRRSEPAFRDLIASHARDDYQLIDIEVGPNNSNGATVFSGLWVRHPNQPKTAVIYDLEAAEFSDLLNPMSGRVLDVERYESDLHGETRYAMIFAMVPGGTWRVARNVSQSTLAGLQNTTADGDTFLIDLDPVPGVANFDAVWGEDAKSLREVAPISAETRFNSPNAALQQQIADYETGVRSNIVGLYARNLTTGTSVGWRMDEFFPLASLMKSAVHFRFWNAVGEGDLNAQSAAQYTRSLNQREDWFCGNDGNGRLNSSNFGQSFTLDRYSRYMMEVSDNAATAVLVDHPNFGTAHLDQTLTEWLSSLDGVGRGWGPLISIHDVDRHILQAGEARDFPASRSLYLAPPWAMEARFRNSVRQGNAWLLGFGSDTYGDLAQYYAPALIPESNLRTGHVRFHDSGWNAATPRGVSRLYEALLQDDIVPASVMNSLLGNMAEFDVVNRHPSFPATNAVYSKGGTKGDEGLSETRVQTDSAMVRIGDDWFTFAILGKHLSYSSGQNRNVNGGRFVNMAYAMLQHIAPNLSACADAQVSVSTSTVSPGLPFSVSCLVSNTSAAPSPAFQVDFHLTSNVQITAGDPLLGTVNIAAMGANQGQLVTWQGVLPANVGNGSYRVGVVVDRGYSSGPSGTGHVGEWNEGEQDNTALSTATLQVGMTLDAIFDNGFE
ncbi:MAG: serine hydrolase [Xanthomonadales bacterium]|nr:serine hydrolase [Xanthomonadales bacterium]